MPDKFILPPCKIDYSPAFRRPGDPWPISRGYQMVLDDNKAIMIVKYLLANSEDEIEFVRAGLDGDWEHNSMVFFENGNYTKIEDYCTASDWAVPVIVVHYFGRPTETFEVWNKDDHQKY